MVGAKNLLYYLLGLVVLKDGLPKFLHAFISLSFSSVAVDWYLYLLLKNFLKSSSIGILNLLKL